MIPIAVYILCALTSLACAFLLIRSYLRMRTGLLFWSALCFVGLFISNLILVADLVFLPPQVDLGIYRAFANLGSGLVLLYGLITEMTS